MDKQQEHVTTTSDIKYKCKNTQNHHRVNLTNKQENKMENNPHPLADNVKRKKKELADS